MGLLPLNFAKNYLWPTLMALGGAIIAALASGLPALLEDGITAEDWPRILAIVIGAVFGYLSNITSRYGGKKAPWTDPPIDPTPAEKAHGL